MDSRFRSFNNVDNSPSAIRPIKVGFPLHLHIENGHFKKMPSNR